MWEAVIAGAVGLMGLYVALRQEVRRSHELLQKDFNYRLNHLDTRLDHLDTRFNDQDARVTDGFTEVRADIRRLDQKIDAVRGELIGFLGPR